MSVYQYCGWYNGESKRLRKMRYVCRVCHGA